MKNINTKLVLGTMLLLGATSCGNEMAQDNGSRLTTNVSDTMEYTDYINRDGVNNSYTNYADTNGYMTKDKMEYVKNDYSFDDVNDFDYKDMDGVVDYRGQETRRRLSNLDNSTYDNTEYDMLLDNRYTNDVPGVDKDDVENMFDNGRVGDKDMYKNNVENTTNNVVDDVRKLADVTMEEVGEVTDNLVRDTKDITNTNMNVDRSTGTNTTVRNRY